MKILWVCPVLLHPTTKGGQIRTLGTLRQLHRWHEIHFAAIDATGSGEALERSREYCSQCYTQPHRVPSKTSPAFFAQLAGGLFSPIPLAVGRFASAALRERVAGLIREQRFDHIVCDFLAAAPNVPDIGQAVLFQHNVETMIWERRAAKAATPVHKALYRTQARRMLAYEQRICRDARHVIAVSEEDAARMRSLFGITHVSSVPTGVDIDFFAPPAPRAEEYHLVFVGSMDWAPNVDGMLYFIDEILPLIRASRPDCRVAVAGRMPPKQIVERAANDPLLTVTGTVPDIRPYLWNSAAAIVPLRIGGGTRLKVYEAMAAKIPVVSTSIGVEGLPLTPGRHYLLADDPGAFAKQCLALLSSPREREDLAGQAWSLVSSRFSWEQAARHFEQALLASVGAPA
jgi:glycosyltransferase involved in cell wall biosynthesis